MENLNSLASQKTMCNERRTCCNDIIKLRCRKIDSVLCSIRKYHLSGTALVHTPLIHVTICPFICSSIFLCICLSVKLVTSIESAESGELVDPFQFHFHTISSCDSNSTSISNCKSFQFQFPFQFQSQFQFQYQVQLQFQSCRHSRCTTKP